MCRPVALTRLVSRGAGSPFLLLRERECSERIFDLVCRLLWLDINGMHVLLLRERECSERIFDLVCRLLRLDINGIHVLADVDGATELRAHLLVAPILPVPRLVGLVAVPDVIAPVAHQARVEKLLAGPAHFLLAAELAVSLVPVELLALLATVHGDVALAAEQALVLGGLATAGAAGKHAQLLAVILANFDQLIVPLRPAEVNEVIGPELGLLDGGAVITGGEHVTLEVEVLLRCAGVVWRVHLQPAGGFRLVTVHDLLQQSWVFDLGVLVTLAELCSFFAVVVPLFLVRVIRRRLGTDSPGG